MPTIELPWPPSVNHYWRMVRGRFYVSGEGVAYRKEVTRRVGECDTLKGRLAVEILLYPPDRRKRDIDNVCKAVLDSLAHAGAYENDCQIDRLSVARQELIEGGLALVTITEV